MTRRYTDPDGDQLEISVADEPVDDVPSVSIWTGNNPVFVPLDRVEELIAGIRDTARQAAGGTT